MAQPSAPAIRLEFRGSAGGYFRIWLVNMVLTVLTLGIYSAWAKVRSRRYFCRNTFLNGIPFAYSAHPLAILGSRIGLAVVFLLWLAFAGILGPIASLLVALLMPWLFARALAFNARNTSYGGIPFACSPRVGRLYLAFEPVLVMFAYSAIEPFALSAQEAAHTLAIMLGIAVRLYVLARIPFMLRSLHACVSESYSWGSSGFAYSSLPNRSSYFKATWLVLACWLALGLLVPLASWGMLQALGIDPDARHMRPLLAFEVASLYFALAVVYACQQRLFFVNLRFPAGNLQFSLPFEEYVLRILVVNYVATVFTLGLLYPWARVRRAKYLAERMSLGCSPSQLTSLANSARTADQSADPSAAAGRSIGWDFGLI